MLFHAHPDDEAIFTGGTIRMLADRDIRTVIVFATGGERGSAAPGESSSALGDRRIAEATAAARLLGAARVVWLGFGDSGLTMPDGATTSHRAHGITPLVLADRDDVAGRLAEVLAEEAADCLVSYDVHGIYGHPDHLVIHRAGVRATELAGTPTRYDATIDREHLHFVETHLVAEARRAGLAADDPTLGDPSELDLRHVGIPGPDDTTTPRGVAGSSYGTPTVEIDVTVDVRGVVSIKRAAMVCHASQIPAGSSALRLDDASFGDVYGIEWFLRDGPANVLDELPSR